LAQHIPRKQLKKDELRETLAHGAEAVLSHRQLTAYVAVAVAVIAFGGFGWRTYSQHRTVKAFAGFDAAMKVFQTPVGAPLTPGETTYPDENKKFTEAHQKFAAVASQYPHTRAGQLASYYSALSLEKLQKNDEAKKLLETLVNGSDVEVAAMAKFELAGLDDRMGRGDEAVNLYLQLIAKPATLVPKAVAMLALADHYSWKNPSEAAKLYGQIKADYPDTPMAQEADEALALLPGKS
jgi:predicted negative regulator of RcsB-dependent stress response